MRTFVLQEAPKILHLEVGTSMHNDNTKKTLDIYDKVAATLPEAFARSAIDELSGKIFTGRYLSNLMSKGEGPVGTRMGNKVVIFRDDFAVWLRERYNSGV